jgi:hypothetical protein
MCAVVSGDNVIGVTGTGSGALPYTVTANVCNGLTAIEDASRNILTSDLAVVVTAGGECALVTVPEVPTECTLPLGGTVNQYLLKASVTDCDAQWATPPYARVTSVDAQSLTTATPYEVLWGTDITDPYDINDGTSTASEIIVPTGWDGWWGIGTNVQFDGGTAGDLVSLRILQNGTVIAQVDGAVDANNSAYLSVSTEVAAVAADSFTVEMLWTGAATMAVGADPIFWASWRAA